MSKTIREWAEELNEPERSSLLEQSNKLDKKYHSLYKAVNEALVWKSTKEGHSYWGQINLSILNGTYKKQKPMNIETKIAEMQKQLDELKAEVSKGTILHIRGTDNNLGNVAPFKNPLSENQPKTIAPFEGTKWVRVVKASRDWYKDKIGQEFEVWSYGRLDYTLAKDENLQLDYNDCIEIPAPEKKIEPFDGTKRVRIISCESELYWYANQIDHLFEVKYFSDDRYLCTEGGTIKVNDCVEEPIAEKKPWEKYPMLESCWGEDDNKLNIDNRGNIGCRSLYEYHYPTESLAKQARAGIVLWNISRKWNEGVEKDEKAWYVAEDGVIDWEHHESIPLKLIPHFHSEELAAKSLELFGQEWKEFWGNG